MPPRKVVTGVLLAAGSIAGSVARAPPPAARRRERVDLYAADGSMVSIPEGSPRPSAAAARPRPSLS